MGTLKRVCVFCGSASAVDPAYLLAAERFGELLARRGIGLVMGGGKVGLMGRVAEGALRAGGEAIGVIPERLSALELAHEGLSELFVVESMHARKHLMAQLSSAFVALPGGYGTLDELFEVVTWTQLGIHRKPAGFLNVRGYYDRLFAFLDHAAGEGFVRGAHAHLLIREDDPEALLERLASAFAER